MRCYTLGKINFVEFSKYISASLVESFDYKNPIGISIGSIFIIASIYIFTIKDFSSTKTNSNPSSTMQSPALLLAALSILLNCSYATPVSVRQVGSPPHSISFFFPESLTLITLMQAVPIPQIHLCIENGGIDSCDNPVIVD